MLHKNPYGDHFIVASAFCTTKSLSKLLTHCLQLILKHYKKYCKGIERRTGVNCFCVINTTEVTYTLDKLRHARALDNFDFTALYTNIPHSQLKTRMEKLIKNACNTRDAAHMALGKDYAYLPAAAKFNNTCGYIDDLLTLNNIDFQACIGQIYPPELQLKKCREP